MKKIVVGIWLTLLLVGTLGIFWYNDWVYNLPTPVPQNYHDVSIGAHVELRVANISFAAKPVFIHFFNPDCPCSRFNIPHFKALVEEYNKRVNFIVVVLSSKKYSAEKIQDKLQLSIPVLFDSTIASVCGVYSTPQAVIIDGNGTLMYRGNYNRSRYCTDKSTNYAQIALEALLQNKYDIIFQQSALKAYGCQLPACNKK
jgi:thiol-disulfide isomerase/thioredoxin